MEGYKVKIVKGNKKWVLGVFLTIVVLLGISFISVKQDYKKVENNKTEEVQSTDSKIIKSDNNSSSSSVQKDNKEVKTENKDINTIPKDTKTVDKTKNNEKSKQEDKKVYVKGVDKKKGEVKSASSPCITCDVKVSHSVVDKYKVQLIIENNSDGLLEIKFPTSQEYEYKLKGSDGGVYYMYSQGKMFSQQEVVKKLEIGDKLVYDIDLKEVFDKNKLPKGNYTLELYSVGKVGVKDLSGVLTVANIIHD